MQKERSSQRAQKNQYWTKNGSARLRRWLSLTLLFVRWKRCYSHRYKTAWDVNPGATICCLCRCEPQFPRRSNGRNRTDIAGRLGCLNVFDRGAPDNRAGAPPVTPPVFTAESLRPPSLPKRLCDAHLQNETTKTRRVQVTLTRRIRKLQPGLCNPKSMFPLKPPSDPKGRI